MKEVRAVREIYKDDLQRLYVTEDGLHVRDVVIDAGIGETVTIGHLSDLHYNYCNAQDMAEANPVVMSTLEHRKWLANGESVPTIRRCFDFLDDVDQIILNGDTLDYLSHGCMELMQREVWDRYPTILASLGGHEVTRRMQGTVADPTTRESRLEILQNFWKHDIFYESRMIGSKVMAVVFFNDVACTNEYQLRRFREDLKTARENGFIMLLFAHELIRSCNPKETAVDHADVLLLGDPTGYPVNFCDGTLPRGKLMGCDACDEPTRALFAEIIGNADVVRGFFAGHWHSDLYSEILAKTADGRDAVIPQFVNTASAYPDGHVMRITVR